MIFRNESRPERPDPEIEMERRLNRVVGPQLEAYVQELDAEIDKLLDEAQGADMQGEALNLMTRFDTDLGVAKSISPDVEFGRLIDAMEMINQILAINDRILEQVKPIRMKVDYLLDVPEAKQNDAAARYLTMTIQHITTVFDSKVAHAFFGGRNLQGMQQELTNALNAHNKVCEPKYRIKYETQA